MSRIEVETTEELLVMAYWMLAYQLSIYYGAFKQYSKERSSTAPIMPGMVEIVNQITRVQQSIVEYVGVDVIKQSHDKYVTADLVAIVMNTEIKDE